MKLSQTGGENETNTELMQSVNSRNQPRPFLFYRHIHDRNKRKRDMVKCYNQKNVTSRRDRQTGLRTVSYKIVSRQEITISDAPATILNIALVCDRTLTPWCDCDNAGGVESNNLSSAVAENIVPHVKKANRYKKKPTIR